MTPRDDHAFQREVGPLELFFDLVFVFAISQMAHHLVVNLSWRGVAEIFIVLVAVCGVWAFTSFEVTLLDIEHAGTRTLAVITMGLGLFMNAGIAHAFDDSAWLFVTPMLIALIGPGVYAARVAPTAPLREHYRRVLAWFGASTPLWILGAMTDDHPRRLVLWEIAAVIDLVGSWTAHPTPRRATHTQAHSFDGGHILERMRLFLIILLGETVLTLGRVISDHHADALTLFMALAGFVSLVCLWAVYFERAEQVVASHTAKVDDPIRSVHVGLNVIYGVVAGLVVLAAGSDLVLAHAHEQRAGVAGVLILVGPMIYFTAQGIYFWVETGTGWRPRAVTAGVLAGAAVAAYWVPPYVAVAFQVVILVGVATYLARIVPAQVPASSL